MTHNDVIGQIRFQIRTPGARISPHTKFGPDWINFRKIDFRKSCYNPLTVKKFENLNQGNHAEFNSLSVNILSYGVSKYQEAVIVQAFL
jgi:hypothetical protein